MGLKERLKRSWNVFVNGDSNKSDRYYTYGFASSTRPDSRRLTGANARTIVAPIFNRIANDCAAIRIEHCRVDAQGRYQEPIYDSLNYCLTEEANIDQTGRALVQDIVLSMFDEGVVAVVPVDTETNYLSESSFGIITLRTAKIVEWYPFDVKVYLYNDRTGQHEYLTLPKEKILIIENPFYAIMNEPNSTLQRLIQKLMLLDTLDSKNSSGKLDIIIQLPYNTRQQSRQDLAEKRVKDVENQLIDSKYGIAYIDANEHITQLNRPAENNLMSQVEYLQKLFYSQLGVSEEIFNGTASEQTMNNYYTNIIEVILTRIVEEIKRKFLTKTARTQGHSIEFFRDPFKLVPVSQLPDIADKFTRNEIMTSNEIRNIIGYRPSEDPRADELRNKNLNQASDETVEYEEKPEEEYEESENGETEEGTQGLSDDDIYNLLSSLMQNSNGPPGDEQ